MRILHTADWHMGTTLGRQSLADDVCHSLDQIVRYLDDYQVDVILVAGDLFCDRSSRKQLQRSLQDIRDRFRPFLARGGTMIAITGNHDSEGHFKLLRDALSLVAPGQRGPNGANVTGRLYMLPEPKLLKLTDAAGQAVQFVAMPYPTASCYLRGDATRYPTIEEKHRAIQTNFMKTLSDLKAKVDPHLPSVLISHIHVRGSNAHTLYRVTESDDVLFEPGAIPTHWSYVAYGHIHRPQAIFADAPHVRYAGSVVRMDRGERADEKGVVLVEMVNNQRVHDPLFLPIKCPPIYHVEITEPESQLPRLAEDYPDAAHALVSYTLHWDAARHHRDALCQDIEAHFPRWYERTRVEVSQGQSRSSVRELPVLHDVSGTVRRYLQANPAGDENIAELLALAEELLAAELGTEAVQL